jgi:DNA-binding MarR family transcriptional regulator
MREGLERLFLREKPASALLAVGELEPTYAALVAKRIDATFPHTSRLLSEMEEQGLIRSRPEGRVRYLELTERGRKVALALGNLSQVLREPGANWDRLERIVEILSKKHGSGAHLRLGPLRRETGKLRASRDEGLRKAAEEVDGRILAAIRA